MGLDVSAHCCVTPVEDTTRNDDWHHEHDHVNLYKNPSFPAQFEGMIEGWHDAYDSYHFCAGPYSRYNRWRAELCRAVHNVEPEIVWNDASYAGEPFYELINFADNEGTIGTAVCGKLMRDFAAHGVILKRGRDRYFAHKYDQWAEAFRMGANGGAVCFG